MAKAHPKRKRFRAAAWVVLRRDDRSAIEVFLSERNAKMEWPPKYYEVEIIPVLVTERTQRKPGGAP